ncbi:MAG: cyclic nucleotide-binding domain-containing protein [Actinomycetota bacterium]
MLTQRGTKAGVSVYDALRRDRAGQATTPPAPATDEWPGIWGSLGIKRRGAPARARKRARVAGRTDVWGALIDRIDPSKLRPKLAPDIETKRFQSRTGGYVMMANPRDLIHFRFDENDAAFIELMDGSRSVEEIVIERLESSGEIELAGVAGLVLTLYEGNFLEQPYIDVDAAVQRALHPGPPLRHKLRTFARTLTLEFGSPQRLVEWLYRNVLKIFFNPAVNAVVAATSLAGLVAFFIVVHRKIFVIGGSSLAAEGLILLVLNYFLTFAHEVGHALVIVRHGRRVKNAGFQIYFGSPAWFVDSSDALMLEPRQRIASSFAGPYADMFLAGISSIVLLVWPHIVVGHLLYKFVVLNYFLIFLNLIPMLELDGYYILSDMLRMPDLRPRSLSFLRHDLFHKIRKRERFHVNEVGLILYGVGGILFSILAFYSGGVYWKELFGGFVSAMWHQGIVTRVILILLGLFVGGPLIRGVINLVRFLTRKVRALWRALRFRLETSWRVEAAQMIDKLPIFSDVPEDVLDELAGRVKLRGLSQGQLAVRQGERAEAFFVVRSGTLEVYETDPATQKERSIRVLGRGESFGELAVVQGSVRSASVRAQGDAEVFEIDRSTFQRLLADMVEVPDFAPTVQHLAELSELKPFKHLEPDELGELLEYGEWEQFPPGETIVREGDAADAFFAIGSGQIDVMKGRKLLRTLGPGEHFGEIALLLEVKRTATCRARTAVRAFRLSREGFDRIMKQAFKKGTLNMAAAADRIRQH